MSDFGLKEVSQKLLDIPVKIVLKFFLGTLLNKVNRLPAQKPVEPLQL